VASLDRVQLAAEPGDQETQAAPEPFVDPAELTAEVRADPLPSEVRILCEEVVDGIKQTELLLRIGEYRGEPVGMHAWLGEPVPLRRTRVPPALVIPGGLGRAPADFVWWFTGRCETVTLGIDWIGAGSSPVVHDLVPWPNQVRLEGDDYRDSYQYRNLCGLLRATNFLLDHPSVDPADLIALGGSWGGFYCWLLAGLDSRFKYILPTFGCGFFDIECHGGWESDFASMAPERAEQWLRAFDPGRRAHLIRASVYYQQATNDKFFSLKSAMRTYHRVRGEKRLLLARNQDHFMDPYAAQDVLVAEALVRGRFAAALPVIGDVRWLPGTNKVEVSAEGADVDVSVVWSGGDYTSAFGRYWRAEPARLEGARWIAEVPVVDPHREVWLYGHVERRGGRPVAASSPVLRVVPAEHGLRDATAAFDPVFQPGGEPLHSLPVGDRIHPEMRLVDAGGRRAVAMRFLGAADKTPTRRGVIYCLEGDLVAAGGYNGIEVTLRVPDPADVRGLKLALVSDFHALAEQTFCYDLESLPLDLSTFQTVRLPFAAFEALPPKSYLFFTPPERPLEVRRLCGVGFYHPEPHTYGGEAWISRVEVVRLSGAPRVEAARAAPLPWPPRRVGLNDPDPLAVTGQGAPAAEHTAAPLQADRADRDPYDLVIETSVPPAELRERLRQYAPWRFEVHFSNGVRTSEFEHGAFFVEHPLAKWHAVKDRIPASALRGRRALDIGTNIGHFPIFLRRTFDMDVVGVDYDARTLEIAHLLVELSGLDHIDLLCADANVFRVDEQFDLILHFGTLDHLLNPYLALENASAMLAPGGYFALELQTYKHPEDPNICLFVPPAKGVTCCWFLGENALLEMMRRAGFVEIETVLEWEAKDVIGERMRRLQLLARKPS
jgi:hypothetical protein